MKTIIDKGICKHVLMTGVYYKHHHPGGISSVVQYWSEYFEDLQYYPTFKEGSKIEKVLIFAFSVIRIIFRLLFDHGIKIVHVHTAAGTDFKRSALIIAIAKFFKKRVILHSHASQFKVFYDDADGEHKEFIINTLKKVDLLIALSSSWEQWFISLGIDPNKITILHNITDYPVISQKGKKISKPLRLLFLGEIGERKGVFDIIKAMATHKEDIEGKVELRIGGNKREEELKQAIVNSKLEKFIIFEGFVSGKKKIELLNWADVFILPSFNEGLPISILEAMSYGMPIISTPIGGIPEVVDDTNGILVTPGDHAEIYNAIKHYVDNPGDIEKHGCESRNKVKTYLPDYVINHLRKIYVDLLDY